MNRYFLATLIAFAPLAATAAPVDGDRIVIIDGDTIALPGGERVRLIDIDAPESFRSRCEAELRLGLAAKARLAELLRGQAVEIERRRQDRYRRTLAFVRVGGVSVGKVLVAEGLAQPWKSGPQAKAARLALWCGGTRW